MPVKTYVLLLSALTLGSAHAASEYAGMAPEEILERLIEDSSSAYLSQSPQNRQMMPDNPA